MSSMYDNENERESMGAWTVRVWSECREKLGVAQMFYNYCLQNHFEILEEFYDFDAMMRGD